MRPVSLTTVQHVRCDFRACRSTYHYTTDDLTAATAKAHVRGWRRVGTADWCPFHASEHRR